MPDITETLLQSGETFASTLLVLTLDRFGNDMIHGEDGPWMPETIRLEIQEKFGTSISDDNLGKLLAAISVIKTDSLFRTLSSFLFTVHNLLGDGIAWSYAEPVETEDLAWSVMESILLSPPKEDEDIFDSQIVAYCRFMLKRDGLITPPSVLAFAKEDEIYGDIAIFGEDILQEQSNRTEEVNRYLENRQQELLNQLASLPRLGIDASRLSTQIQTELAELADRNRWD
jgi:hypothetical protein